MLAIDRWLHPFVETRLRTSPPDQVAAGSAFIIPAGATGLWANHGDSVASHDGSGWDIASPARGTLVWIADEQSFSVFDGSWSTGVFPAQALNINGRLVLGADPVPMANPTGGSVIDEECRAAIDIMIASLRAQGIVL
ncbi:MAG: DUF2793 domain-containing protein [Sandarakinorhabdus sp.]|nr:DUF2793 domain-containing protein [Sandarakinorhabdus sp.]